MGRLIQFRTLSLEYYCALNRCGFLCMLLPSWKGSLTSHELFRESCILSELISSQKNLISFCVATVVARLLPTKVHIRVATLRPKSSFSRHSTSVAKYRLASMYVSVELGLTSIPPRVGKTCHYACWQHYKLALSTAFTRQPPSCSVRERTIWGTQFSIKVVKVPSRTDGRTCKN